MASDETKNRGLYPKFEARLTSPSIKHKNCDFFVLDLTHDPDAVEAALWYADSIGNAMLYQDLLSYRNLPHKPYGQPPG